MIKICKTRASQFFSLKFVIAIDITDVIGIADY